MNVHVTVSHEMQKLQELQSGVNTPISFTTITTLLKIEHF